MRFHKLVNKTLLLPIVVLPFFLAACNDNGSSGSGDGDNTLPTVSAGADQTVNEQTLVTLSGAGSVAEGSVTFLWEQISGATVTLGDASAATTDFSAPDVTADTTLDFRLTVTDADGESSSDTVAIILLDASSAANNPPTVNAGLDQTVTEGATVVLAGTAQDAEGAVDLLWTQTAGPNVTLSADNVASVSFTAPVVTADTNLVFELQAIDSDGVSVTDQVQVTVTDNSGTTPPTTDANWRIKTISYDFDLNGVVEGVRTYSYNPDGTVMGSDYIYTDDGVIDTDFISFSLSVGTGDENESEEFSYDSDGRVESWIITTGDQRIEQVFAWSNDVEILQVTQEMYDNSVLSAQIVFDALYTADLLTHVDGEVTFPNMVSFDLDLSYDAAGVLVEDTWQTSTMGTTLTETREFTWSSEGAIDLVRTYNPDPSSSYEAISDFIYEDGRIEQRTHSTTSGTLYNWLFEYNSNDLIDTQFIDMSADGSNEAAIYYEWEEIPCVDSVVWLARAEPMAQKRLDTTAPLNVLGDGHTVVPACGYPEPAM